MQLGHNNPKPAGTWDFYGEGLSSDSYMKFTTISVGIFQWVPKSSGKTTKKAVAVKRLTNTDRARLILDACKYCELLQSQFGDRIVDPKTIKIRLLKDSNEIEITEEPQPVTS